ncbi:MAG: GNAT family N-acetyltransferase [Vampirovibrionales bacterium]
MFPMIDTPRLCLRLLRPDDAPAMVRIAQKPAVAASVAVIPTPYTLDDALAWIQLAQSEALQQRSRVFGVVLASDSQCFIGNAGIHRASPTHPQAEVGYWLDEAYWGQGLATELLHALCNTAFTEMGISELTATVAVSNIASQRVLSKAGFQQGDICLVQTRTHEQRPSYRYYLSIPTENIPHD